MLGDWTLRQRRNYKKGQISDKRIKLLDDLGFAWDFLEQEWQEKYQDLKQYIRENGNTLASARHPTLGNWVVNQRPAYKKGKLSDE
jgi:hypothetical protein